jgi:hypothetical protein
LEGFQPPPQQEVQAETRTNHASGAGEAHKVAVHEKNNRTKYDAEEKKKDAEPVKLEEDEPVKPEETGQYVPMDTTEQNVKPEKGGLWGWLTSKFSGGKISEPNKEEFYNELNNMVKDIVENQFKDVAKKEDVDRIISELSPLIKNVGDATIQVEKDIESKDESVGGLLNDMDKDIKKLEQRGFIITEEDIDFKKRLIQGIAELNIAAKNQEKNSINSVIEKLYDMIKGKEGAEFDEIRMDLLEVKINLVKRGLSNVNSAGNFDEVKEELKEELKSLKKLFLELGNIVVKQKNYGPQLDTMQEELDKIQSGVTAGRITNVRVEVSQYDVLNAIEKLSNDLSEKVKPRSPRSGAQALIGENVLNPRIIQELKESLVKLNANVKSTSANFTNLGRALEKKLNTIAEQYGKKSDEKLDNVIEALKKQEMEILKKNQNMLESYLQKFNQLHPNPNSENPQARSILESQLKELREEMKVQFSALATLIGRLEGKMQGQSEISKEIVEQMKRVPYNSQELPVLLDVIMENPSQALIDEQTVFIENLLKQFFIYLQNLGNQRPDETVINNIFNTMNVSLFLPSNPQIEDLIQNVKENLVSKGVNGTEDRFQGMDMSSEITRRPYEFISTDESQSNMEQNVRKRAKSSPDQNPIVEPQTSKPIVMDKRLADLQELSKRKNMFSQGLTFEELSLMIPAPSTVPFPAPYTPRTPQNYTPQISVSSQSESPSSYDVETPRAAYDVDYIDEKDIENEPFDLTQQGQETSALPLRSRRFESSKSNELARLQRLAELNPFGEHIVPSMNYYRFARELVRSRFPTEFEIIAKDSRASNLLVSELLGDIKNSFMTVSSLTRKIVGGRDELRKKVNQVLRAMERQQKR